MYNIIMAELNDLEKLQKQVENLKEEVENLKLFIRFNNNDIAEIVMISKSFYQYRQLLDNYYYMLSDHGESTQDDLMDKGYFIDEDANYQPKYQEYKDRYDAWSLKVYKSRKEAEESKVVKGGKTRKNRKSRK